MGATLSRPVGLAKQIACQVGGLCVVRPLGHVRRIGGYAADVAVYRPLSDAERLYTHVLNMMARIHAKGVLLGQDATYALLLMKRIREMEADLQNASDERILRVVATAIANGTLALEVKPAAVAVSDSTVTPATPLVEAPAIAIPRMPFVSTTTVVAPIAEVEANEARNFIANELAVAFAIAHDDAPRFGQLAPTLALVAYGALINRNHIEELIIHNAVQAYNQDHLADEPEHALQLVRLFARLIEYYDFEQFDESLDEIVEQLHTLLVSHRFVVEPAIEEFLATCPPNRQAP